MDRYRPLDADARATALALVTGAVSGALGTLRGRAPVVTRVGCAWLPGQGMTLLISDLSDHARSLAETPTCSLLVGEAGARGDPLTHPRLTLTGRAEAADKAALRGAFLAARPKSALYYDFTDFRLLRIVAEEGLLNGGFGKAYRFGPDDLAALGA